MTGGPRLVPRRAANTPGRVLNLWIAELPHKHGPADPRKHWIVVEREFLHPPQIHVLNRR
jgi:hypothetical protein